MKYEFHVGDYVETKDGDIGIITEVNSDCNFCWYCTYSSKYPHTKNQTYIIPDVTDDMTRIFKRIGQYDFTKKDESKIKSLVKSYLLGNTDSKGKCYVDSREIIKKINELVEAMNKLRDKND